MQRRYGNPFIVTKYVNNKCSLSILIYGLLSFPDSGTCADREGGGEAGGPDPLKNHKAIGFLSNTGPDPLKNHKATKPAFNVGPTSARQRNAIEMTFRCWVDNGLFLVVFGSSLTSTEQKNKIKCYQTNFLDVVESRPVVF